METEVMRNELTPSTSSNRILDLSVLPEVSESVQTPQRFEEPYVADEWKATPVTKQEHAHLRSARDARDNLGVIREMLVRGSCVNLSCSLWLQTEIASQTHIIRENGLLTDRSHMAPR
ncbi:uncharacterized protein PV06_08233 [Exophiala oligosperma]|uniref:Uncharacterized protein n=1 Tax=Exophiala oligosperma TaxID=215243 RepID=A0A0D2AHM9_9EURO|nr:uncharacterized protein PV06_08233 [Exophiala oligosperma]KIW39636.1 hypothetical protein PV06_08233 [Exophiala oligosperma]